MTIIQFDVSTGEFIRSLPRYSRYKAALSATDRMDYSANFPNCPDDLSGVGEAPLHGAPSHDPETHKAVSTAPYLDGETWRNETLASLTPQEIADRLDTHKQAKRIALRSKFAQERDKGVLVNDNLIATTHAARIELAALVDNLTANGGTQKGVTRDGKRVVFNLATTSALLAAVDAHHAACNAREYDLDVAIEAAADKASLDAIDITSGWPVSEQPQ